MQKDQQVVLLQVAVAELQTSLRADNALLVRMLQRITDGGAENEPVTHDHGPESVIST